MITNSYLDQNIPKKYNVKQNNRDIWVVFLEDDENKEMVAKKIAKSRKQKVSNNQIITPIKSHRT